MAVQCDVASAGSVRAAFAKVSQRYPKIDVLINNAAVFEPALMAEASDGHIINTINTNLIGSMFCPRATIPMMNRGGRIINVSSESLEVPFAHLITYQASKAGLERFSLSLHQELQSSGIQVTTIRAGQMMEEGKSWDVDRQAAIRFAQANLERGIDPRNRPKSHVSPVTAVFRAVIDMPVDVHAVNVQVTACAPGVSGV